MKFYLRLSHRPPDGFHVPPQDPLRLPRPEGLEHRLLHGKPARKSLGFPYAPSCIPRLDVREHTAHEPVTISVQEVLHPPHIHDVDTNAYDHRFSARDGACGTRHAEWTRSAISRTAFPKPTNTPPAMLLCPMLNPSISGSERIGTMFRRSSPC